MQIDLLKHRDAATPTTAAHPPCSWAWAGRLALTMAILAPQHMLAAPAVARWTITDLGALGGAYSSGTALNNTGQVAGSSDGRAFVYAGGAMTDLGTLGGPFSYGHAINDAGQVTGNSYVPAGGQVHAFLYSGGTMLDLGTLGGSSSYGHGVNNAGQVTGYAYRADTRVHAFVYRDGRMVDIGTLGGRSGYGRSINDAGHVTGYAQTADDEMHAFVYSNGSMTDLGTLGGTSSFGMAINNAGQVTGYAATAGNRQQRAFVTSNGRMTDLGTLGGSVSAGYGINSAGQVTGYSYTTGDGELRAFLYSNGVMTDLNGLNGVVGSGWTVSRGAAINDRGQLTGEGTFGGQTRAFLLTLDTATWQSQSSGAWQGAGNGWAYGSAPDNALTQVFIDPARSLTVTGPTGNVTVKALTIGGDASGNNGIATLNLSGGTISVAGDANRYTTVNPKGVLTGDGLLTGRVHNLGTVTAANLTLSGGLDNQGLVNGNGRLNADLNNSAGGLVQVGAGQVLLLDGTAHSNAGRVEVKQGGDMQVTGAFDNRAGGVLRLDNANLRFADGIDNAGEIQVSFGGASVVGKVTMQAGGKVILSGHSNTTFHDAVDVERGGELRVSAGSTGVFFGQVLQRSGALFTGSGSKFYEGGLSIGDSPGLGGDAGSVSLGANNVYLAEIGGLTAGSGFDKYTVAGKLSFDGSLTLVSWQGFTGQAGQSFDLFDWGSSEGVFADVDTSGLLLAAGTRLDTSRLYIDGSVSVTAVPEPHPYALLLAGLGLVGFVSGRRRDRLVPSDG